MEQKTLETVQEEILAAAKTYLEYTSDIEDVPADDFLLLLIQRVAGEYKSQRNYPDDVEDEVVEADTVSYFTKKLGYVATEVIPAILGKIGGEGLYSLVDNQVSKNWKYPFAVYLPDVVPYCKVVV